MASSAKQEMQEIDHEDQLFFKAMELAMSSILPMTMQAAIELGIFDVIAKMGPRAKLSATEIAAQLRTKNSEAPTMVDRILRLLASHSVLTCSIVDHQRLYGMAPVSKYFVPNEDGVSLSPFMALFQHKLSVDSWCQVKDAVLEGGVPFERVCGVPAFEYCGKNPRLNEVFNKAMFNHCTIITKKLLETYKGFENVKQLVDVGGSLGVTLHFVTSKYPSIKGVNFDLPHVIQHASSYPRIKHVGGDMFESVPKGDAIFLSLVLHNWGDEQCINLLKNCFNAIPNDGKVIVMDQVVPVMPETSAVAKINFQLDLVMMTTLLVGKERTEQEFMALATGAGFSGITFVCQVHNYWVMEFLK